MTGASEFWPSSPEIEAIPFTDKNTTFSSLAQDFGDVVYTFEIPFHGKTFILKVRTSLGSLLGLFGTGE